MLPRVDELAVEMTFASNMYVVFAQWCWILPQYYFASSAQATVRFATGYAFLTYFIFLLD